MKLTIQNCQNIKSGITDIAENCINIKIGLNGTGKTTIFKVLERILNHRDLSDLTPYSLIGCDKPSASLDEDKFSSLFAFNEAYIRDHVFLGNRGLVENAFEILFTPDNFPELVKKRDDSVEKLHLVESDSVFQLFLRFSVYLQNNVQITKETKTYSKASLINSLISNGGLKKSTDRSVKAFSPWINSGVSNEWRAWHIKGVSNYSPINSSKCPFCGQKISLAAKQSIDHAGELITKKALSALENATAIEDAAKVLLSKGAYKKYHAYLFSGKVYPQANKFFFDLYEEFLQIQLKVIDVSTENYGDLTGVFKEKENRKKYLIFKKDLRFFKGDLFCSFLSKYNSALRACFSDSIKITKASGIYQSSITKEFLKNQAAINDFLKKCGTPYVIRQGKKEKKEDENCVFLASTDDPKQEIFIDEKEHLSYGERNSLALAIFALEARTKTNTLFVLDDPVSSYDEEKQAAMFDFLFGKSGLLRGKTALLLTHEIKEAVNFLSVNETLSPSLKMYSLININGVLTENNVSAKDIVKTSAVFLGRAKDKTESFFYRLLNLRKYLDLQNPTILGKRKIDAAYNLISSFLKARDEPTNKNGKSMRPASINWGGKLIQGIIPEFNYSGALATIKPVENAISLYGSSDDPECKVSLLRTISAEASIPLDKSYESLINHFFHVESSYLFTIDPKLLNAVSPSLLTYCDHVVNTLKADLGK
jgi:energy-coupling factor transporter ATP-binding protein EcfA2